MDNQKEPRPISIDIHQTIENITNFYCSKNELTGKFHYEHMDKKRMKEVFNFLLSKLKNETLSTKVQIAIKTI